MIGYNSSVDGGTTSSTTTLSWNHTFVTGDIAFVFCDDGTAGNDDITGVTCGGVAMTLVQKRQNQFSGRPWSYVFVLPNPSAGSQAIVVSCSLARDLTGLSIAYNGASNSSQPDNSKIDDNNTTSETVSLTSVADKCWDVLFVCNRSNILVNAGTGSTKRITTASPPNHLSIFDSNADITPAGSYSMTVTSGSAMSNATIMVSIIPGSSPVVTSNFLAMF